MLNTAPMGPTCRPLCRDCDDRGFDEPVSVGSGSSNRFRQGAQARVPAEWRLSAVHVRFGHHALGFSRETTGEFATLMQPPENPAVVLNTANALRSLPVQVVH